MCWGIGKSTAQSTPVSFPTSYTTKVVITVSMTGTLQAHYTPEITSITTTGFTYYQYVAGTPSYKVGYHYISIGY